MKDILKNETRNDDIHRVASLDYGWEKLNGKTLLISGGTGFIGSAIIDVVKCRNEKFGNSIRVISLSRHAREDEAGVRYLACDVTEEINVPYPVDYILHLASNTHPAQYAKDPVGTIETNVAGCNNLLKLAIKKEAKRFLLASSVEIYGQCEARPVDETYCGYIDCNTARAGYNEAKRVCESLTQSYRSQYGIDAVTVRLARCFGEDKTKKDTKAMAQFMDCARNGEDIVLKSKGEQRFSYCYYADAVSAIFKVLLDGADGEAYNVADDDDGSDLAAIASYLAALCGTKVVFDLQNAVVGASKATFALLNCDKLKKLGWTPLFTLKEGLRRSIGG